MKDFLKQFVPVSYNAFYREIKALREILEEEIRNYQEINKRLFDIVSVQSATIEKYNILNKNYYEETTRQCTQANQTQISFNEEIMQQLVQINQTQVSLNEEITRNSVQFNQQIAGVKEQVNIRHDNTKYWVMETRRGLIRTSPRPSLKIDVHLADHCNLNCASCDHFSPLAKSNQASLEEFEQDMKKLFQLMGDRLQGVSLLGGEPLLNPKAAQFPAVVRKYFPYASIDFTTNGLLLPKQSEEFWKACRENNVSILVTKYPVNFDYECIHALSEEHGVDIKFYGNSGQSIKTLYHLSLNLKGEQNPVDNFSRCYHANNCIMLHNGKLYPCTVAPNIRHFNEYYNTNLQESQFDGIDIYSANSGEEIFQFLSSPIPFCRYCDCDNRTYGNPWQLSKRDIKEWT